MTDHNLIRTKEIWEERYGDNPDVIGCDLDGSKLIVPDSLKIPEVPELLEKEVIHRLTLVSQPGLVAADLAFPPQKQSPSPPVLGSTSVFEFITSSFTMNHMV